MAKITEIPTQCPNCGGEVWDNTKRPKRNPKAPDVACKDKEYCKWAGWLPASAKSANGTTRAPQEYPHAQLYKLCVQYAIKEIRPLFPDRDLLPEQILAAAATLFIQASKGGDIFKKAAAPEPADAAPPPPAPSPARPAPPPRRADYDDEIPF